MPRDTTKHRLLLLGAGKIGRMIAKFLTGAGQFDLTVADYEQSALDRLTRQTPARTLQLDATDPAALAAALAGCDSVISALSYYHNPLVAEAALAAGASYFDLTEDVATTARVKAIAEQAAAGQVFMPQCGLAPGFISLAAHQLTHYFDELESVRMRVGALPEFPTNALKYNLTWSTDGLINEYCNPCQAIHQGRQVDVLPLEGLEHFSLDGVRYEAFNTSGGLGTLCETLAGRVRELNYKTVRYQGHRDLMHFLVADLRLAERRGVLKDILEHALPITFQDVVVTFCAVAGRRKGQYVQLNDARKIYSQEVDGEPGSAIQITTAAGICAMVDLHAAGKLAGERGGRGFIRQEDVAFETFIANRFGKWFGKEIAAPPVSEFDEVRE